MTWAPEESSPSDSSAEGVRPAIAAAIATAAYAVPYLLSRSTTPTPNHPKVFFWYRGLEQPAIKPPDVAIPIAWLARIRAGFRGIVSCARRHLEFARGHWHCLQEMSWALAAGAVSSSVDGIYRLVPWQPPACSPPAPYT